MYGSVAPATALSVPATVIAVFGDKPLLQQPTTPLNDASLPSTVVVKVC
jgi:hypothetical protein